ncbi:hypothetical protein AB4254_12285 [Vibrio breoganii]
MPSIRVQHNHNNVILDGENVVSGRALAYDTIPAKMQNGSDKFLKFKGFVDFDATTLKKKVALKRITGFYFSEDGFGESVTIPEGHLVLGFVFMGDCYVPLKHGRPLHWKPS